MIDGYWSRRFKAEGMIWGIEPSPTVLEASNIFQKYGVHNVLVPGGGYGRNAKALTSHFQVDVVELSPDAIALAREWDPASQYIEGSALEMNLDKTYEGIYCYDLLHLFLCRERYLLIHSCAQHLSADGIMYFTCFSDEDPSNGIGKNLEPGTYEYKEGKYAHFFSEADLREHFHGYHILEMGKKEEVLTNQAHESYSYLLRYIVVQNNNSK